AELRFRVMGSAAHLVVHGAGAAGAQCLGRARERLEEMEARWSRFRADSELCRVNAGAGGTVRVSADTARVVRRSVEAWRLTGGLFDPTVLPAVESAGYDRTFAEVAARVSSPAPDSAAAPTPGCAGIRVTVDELGGTVRLPAGVRLDLGGIGKGYAADQVVHELRRHGAAGACVNLGGDVRVSGGSPDPPAWSVGVTDPFDEAEDPGLLAVLAVEEGAVATSSRTRRRWRRGAQEMHHLIDPRTGEPARTGLAAVTVVAAEAHWAEILAKSALLAGREAGTRLLGSHGLAALLVTDTGDVLRVGATEGHERWTRSCGGTSPAPVG
ncbi:MAG: FAD:protein FMN transferase, partial [Actinomycetota bacterium]|nr:FAD:protein FMN transferase [Actinomycetota bacterium]